VHLKFEDGELERLAYEPEVRARRWSPDITRAYRRVIYLIANATDERDLRQFKGLRLEKLKGKRAGTSSVRINDQYRLVLRFEITADSKTAVVIEAVDYH
jgi:proteic killer suppression protein